jgi:hypothetical protein
MGTDGKEESEDEVPFDGLIRRHWPPAPLVMEGEKATRLGESGVHSLCEEVDGHSIDAAGPTERS